MHILAPSNYNPVDWVHKETIRYNQKKYKLWDSCGSSYDFNQVYIFCDQIFYGDDFTTIVIVEDRLWEIRSDYTGTYGNIIYVTESRDRYHGHQNPFMPTYKTYIMDFTKSSCTYERLLTNSYNTSGYNTLCFNFYGTNDGFPKIGNYKFKSGYQFICILDDIQYNEEIIPDHLFIQNDEFLIVSGDNYSHAKDDGYKPAKNPIEKSIDIFIIEDVQVSYTGFLALIFMIILIILFIIASLF